VRSLIQFGIEELQAPHTGDCPTCNQLRRGLKEAVMYALLSATWTHLHSPVTAQTQLRNAEINLTYALKDFREHRKIWHTPAPIASSWAAAARNAS
jgi:hypothetical protein